jgi:magnesium and cobalt transporter
MNAESSREGPDEGADEPEPSQSDDRVTEAQQPGILGRLLGWSTNGTAVDGEDDDGSGSLGSAFSESSPAELAMVTNILRLRDLRVEDVMTPRADIEAVAVDAPLDEVLAAFERGSLSRLPVFRETLDDPIGFVHLKDLALNYGFGRGTEGQEFSVSDHIRTALFVPPSMRIAALLQKMQGERVHMALVIDEFGGVDGLVTIEDLVEQIVGDIEDEHDAEDADLWAALSEKVYLISARAEVREFEAETEVSLLREDWDEEVDTFGGLVFMLANRVPTRGEVIVHPSGHEFEIVDADPRRIKRIRLTIGGTALTGGPALRQAAE